MSDAKVQLALKSNDSVAVPVVTIDGPSGTGKGTLAHRLAEHLSWRVLDSGAIYRVLAFAALVEGIELSDAEALAQLARTSAVQFLSENPLSPKILLNNQDVTTEIRNETVGDAASRLAQYPSVRLAVLEWQRQFRQFPGLIADGRDMGTVVFPRALVKIYLDASPEIRSQRRHAELLARGINVSLEAVFTELTMRDQRDMHRQVAPLKPAADAVVMDTSHLTKEAVFQRVLAVIEKALQDR